MSCNRWYRSSQRLLWILVALAAAPGAQAFNPPVDSAGPLTARIEGPATIDEIQVPQPIKVILENRGGQPLQAQVRLQLIDDWTHRPADAVPVQVPAGGAESVEFHITADPATYAAHYPIHALVEATGGGQTWTAHPILIVLAEPPAAAGPARAARQRPWQLWPLSSGRVAALWRLPIHCSVLTVFGGEPATMPVGWTGSESQTRGSVRIEAAQRLGDAAREAIAIHPPWSGGQAGTAWIEFPLQLPEATPLRLHFATGVTPTGNGDGVTFRVRVADWEDDAGQAGEAVFARHSAAKSWEAAEVDLSRFAGRKIRLQFESHPGPRNNTAFDQSYWGEPTLVLGDPPAERPFPPENLDGSRRLGTIRAGGEPFTAHVWLGDRGLLDACVGFLSDQRQLYFRGFRVRVLDQRLDDPGSPVELLEARVEPAGDGVQVHHRFATPDGELELVGKIEVHSNTLRAGFRLAAAPAESPWFAPHIQHLAVDRFSQALDRVYAGHGNVIVRPEAFRLAFDGHRLATSHVGFDFTNGMSLVQAVDLPPEALVVEPAADHYSLHTAHDATLTFIPAGDVWEAAKVYRQTNGWQAAAGVQRLAGRFVFDLWGGRYGQSGEELQRAFRYGLTDSAVIWHNWQRWGYDYRLPEIYPPNPGLGTEQELVQMIEQCRQADVLFALHDNYIDFYPDAEGFSYQRTIAFSADRRPVRAWFNRGRDAQSYRYRADQVEPFLQSNLRTIAAQLRPTAYFIDVWSSINPYDYWTADGQFHDRVGTRDSWGEHFDWIRELLGNDAPQISESGHDQLIGHLDGATANHLRVGQPLPGEYSWSVWDIRCEDAQRTCWFDFAHHDRFALHGAGYAPRYQAGLDARLHGIDSDDYLATEILTGHPGMVSRPFGRDVVRKYWLSQDVMRALALRTIEEVEFVGGDIHRQHVRWSGGGEVWVNRGESDWKLGEAVLPPYGFLAEIPAEGGRIRCELVRRDGVIVEASSSAANLYVNGRQAAGGPQRIAADVLDLKPAPGGRIALDLELDAQDPIPAGYRLFLHFVDDAGEIAFQGGYDAAVLARQNEGRFRIPVTAKLPDARAGTSWELRLGFYHPRRGGERLALAGPEDGQRRLRLGSLQLPETEGEGQEPRWSAWEAGEDPLLARLNSEATPIDFGAVITAGGCRLTPVENGLLLVPLPDSHRAGSAYALGWDRLPWKLPRPEHVEALDEAGRVLRREPAGEDLTVHAADGVFGYRFVATGGR